jgi:hypothetical protein
MSIRVVIAILIAVVAAAGAGWFAGASGRSAVEVDRARFELRAEFAEARALVQDGRVSLFLSNFGDAVERFERARGFIGRVQSRVREMGQVEQAGRLEVALSHLSDAQRAAASFDPKRGQAAAEEALKAMAAASGGS